MPAHILSNPTPLPELTFTHKSLRAEGNCGRYKLSRREVRSITIDMANPTYREAICDWCDAEVEAYESVVVP